MTAHWVREGRRRCSLLRQGKVKKLCGRHAFPNTLLVLRVLVDVERAAVRRGGCRVRAGLPRQRLEIRIMMLLEVGVRRLRLQRGSRVRAISASRRGGLSVEGIRRLREYRELLLRSDMQGLVRLNVERVPLLLPLLLLIRHCDIVDGERRSDWRRNVQDALELSVRHQGLP